MEFFVIVLGLLLWVGSFFVLLPSLPSVIVSLIDAYQICS